LVERIRGIQNVRNILNVVYDGLGVSMRHLLPYENSGERPGLDSQIGSGWDYPGRQIQRERETDRQTDRHRREKKKREKERVEEEEMQRGVN
jgi:hypothetical protein